MALDDVPTKSVFDCNVFLQAMANPNRPAGACLSEVRSGRIALFLSQPILAEFMEVTSRPVLTRKLALTVNRTSAFVEDLLSYATLIDPVAREFSHPTDPKDSIYVDLAIAAGACVITSRDRHLLALRDPTDPNGAEFMSRFPEIDVLTPIQLLQHIRGVTRDKDK
jgi:putative PIN family toxin of toxin-antitoxin system